MTTELEMLKMVKVINKVLIVAITIQSINTIYIIFFMLISFIYLSVGFSDSRSKDMEVNMPVKFAFDVPESRVAVSESIKTRRGDEVRIVRLSKTRAMLIGPSLPENTSIIWENPPDQVAENVIGDLWDKGKALAKKVVEAVVDAIVDGGGGNGGGGGGGGGGNTNNQCQNNSTTVIINGDNIGGVTINCQPQ